jgi:hypothetical protein
MLATIAYAIIAAFQLGAIKDQLGEMKVATRVSENSAYAACINSQIARSTLMEIQAGGNDSHNVAVGTLTQAAAVIWATAAQIKITPSPAKSIIVANSVISIPWVVENIGKSAAHNLKIVAVVRLIDAGTEPEFTYPRHPMNQNKIGNLFPNDPRPMLVFTTRPGVSTDANIPVALTQQEYWRYEAGQLYISEYGRGTYTDIFGKSHWIQFCDHISSNLMTEQLTRHKKCGAYNDSDNQPLEGKRSLPTNERLPDDIVCVKPKD